MPPNSSDMSRWEQLEKRVQALEDVNAIRNLKARYAAEWKFQRKTSAPLFHSPFEEGWARTRFG
jgi:hypothetical protein